MFLWSKRNFTSFEMVIGSEIQSLFHSTNRPAIYLSVYTKYCPLVSHCPGVVGRPGFDLSQCVLYLHVELLWFKLNGTVIDEATQSSLDHQIAFSLLNAEN